jgi:hypothetical protein
VSDDLLDALLREAQREGALGPEVLSAFAEALRARAERILDDRVRALDERAALLARDNDSLRAEAKALHTEIEGVRDQHRSSAEAHARLLQHHRHVVSTVVSALEALPTDLPGGDRGVREKLSALVASLRREVS